MTKYILKRVGYSIVTLFLLVAITFFMMQLLCFPEILGISANGNTSCIR